VRFLVVIFVVFGLVTMTWGQVPQKPIQTIQQQTQELRFQVERLLSLFSVKTDTLYFNGDTLITVRRDTITTIKGDTVLIKRSR